MKNTKTSFHFSKAAMAALTPAEKKFLEKYPTEESIHTQKSEWERQLKLHLLKPQREKTLEYFQHDLMYKMHPEAVEWAKDPNGVQDPNELNIEPSILGQVHVRLPKTNAQRLQELVNEWFYNKLLGHQVREYDEWLRWDVKRKDLEDAVQNRIPHDIQEWHRIQQLLQIPPVEVSHAVIPFLERLIAPPDVAKDKKAEKRKRSGEEPREITGIVLPYSSKDRLRIERRTDSIVLLNKRRKPELTAVLHPPNVLTMRDPQEFHWLTEAMNQMAQDPKAFFAERGKTYGLCMLCNHPLTDEVSKQQGYGPVCAQHLR